MSIIHFFFIPQRKYTNGSVYIARIVRIVEYVVKNNLSHDKIVDYIDIQYNNISFPDCESIFWSGYKRPKCGTNRCAVLTSNQMKILGNKLSEYLDGIDINIKFKNTIITKIRAKCLDKIEKIEMDETLDDNEYLRLYINSINGRNRPEKNAGKFFYVCARKDSYYNFIKNNTVLNPLNACKKFQ